MPATIRRDGGKNFLENVLRYVPGKWRSVVGLSNDDLVPPQFKHHARCPSLAAMVHTVQRAGRPLHLEERKMLELLGYIVLVFSFIGLIYALGVAFGE